MSKLDQLKSLLIQENLWAKKSLGQNFLIDEKALEIIVESAEISPDDRIIEVGPGTGFLTEKLIEKAKKVTAIEYDADMVKILEKRFKNKKNLEIIQSDILKLNLSNVTSQMSNVYKVVANIPYYITSPLIKFFLQAEKPPTNMVLLVQKEVAEKICGLSGKSLITIETQLFGKPEIIANVPAKSFYPAPKVESAILKISTHKTPLVPENELKNFLRIVKFGFSQKRKKLANTLSAGLHLKPKEIREKLMQISIDPDQRAEHLSMEDWQKIATLFESRE